jgi:hypothetical protein
MALVTVYDAKGVPASVDACDAREYVASGSWFSANPTATEGKAVHPAPEMNGTQLRATLVAMGIEVKSNATKAEMNALLDEATKKE